ncbi:hypothetical protein TAFFO16_159 [Bacillus phage Taffo16]|uniref:Uncharacterized protein n=1 Tax=Bacillus phage Taffo16 TaxID=2030094 RepID=A0A249XVC2_9CAUD|nr:hypothetical protein TAFFO16_159 [Bacillus phage Taffo16]
MRNEIKTVGELIDFLGDFDRDKEVLMGINEFFADHIRLYDGLGVTGGSPLLFGMTDKFAKYIHETDRELKDSMEYPELAYITRTSVSNK